MIQCAYCGRENQDHAARCHECGSELHAIREPHAKPDEPSSVFAGNPEAKRYWKLAAVTLAISFTSIVVLVTWGQIGHPVQWFLILIPSRIASAVGIVAGVRCYFLCRGTKQHVVMGLPGVAHLYILLLWLGLSGVSMGR